VGQDNLEVVRRFVEAARRNIDAYMADRDRMLELLREGAFPDPAGAADFLTEDAEWHTLTPPGPHRGTAQMGKVWAHWLETADDYALTLGETTAIRDHVVGELVASFHGAGSGLRVEQRFFSVFTVRDERIARIEDFLEHDRAIAAAEAS
jgi:ketosteroid isomerase-like protein